MSSAPPSTSDRISGRPLWPWLALVLALVWEILVRLPLILNAAMHLDSDLGVDGLTLLEATRGQWRWHYPGTPAIGTLPVLLSLPQALVWGATPITLVSGGTVAYGLLTVVVFLLAWRTYGPGTAAWSLVPLAFGSTGMLWLTGRITGGHVLTAAWHAGAFLGLSALLQRGTWLRAAALGFWCGLGVYLDAMFLVTLAGIAAGSLLGWYRARAGARGLAYGLVGVLAFLPGAALPALGRRLEPHDAYGEQFRIVTAADLLSAHGRILVLECLPRLIVGHRLPGLEADPDPRALAGPGPVSRTPDTHPGAWLLTTLGLVLFPLGLLRLGLAAARGSTAEAAVSTGLIVSAAAVLAGFVTNENIYNSDNYRYLVTLVVPWAVGFGVMMNDVSRRGRGGLLAAWLCGLLLAGLLTLDTARWYARLGWVDARGLPRRAVLDEPALAWLESHPEVKVVVGDYWDVYRLAFLTGGRVRGIPLPIYPNRFPEWFRQRAEGDIKVEVFRATPQGSARLAQAVAAGGRIVFRQRGIVITTGPEGVEGGRP